MLEDFVLGRKGMGSILSSAESWRYFDVFHVHTEKLR